jgi:hypothetical protein
MICCLNFGIAKETCGPKMQKDQGVVIKNSRPFFVEPKNICHKGTKTQRINLLIFFSALVS